MSIYSTVANIVKNGADKIKAYHGSPHDFDKFSTDNIGTGEGAQAYGRGLYFAERKGTAESYRDSLTARDAEYEDWLGRQYKNAENQGDYGRMEMYERAMMHDLPKEFRETAADLDYDKDYRDLANQVADEIEAFTKVDGTKPNFGKMYEVEIDANDTTLLDYDVKLKDQPKEVQEKVFKAFNDDLKSTVTKDDEKLVGELFENDELDELLQGMPSIKEQLLDSNGAQIMGRIKANDPVVQSKVLESAGIKGIKYADAQTRFSPKGKTHNYVVFNDDMVYIAKKYGITPVAASAVLAGTMTPEQAQAGALKSGLRRAIDARYSNAVASSAPRKGVLSKTEEVPVGIENRTLNTGDDLKLEQFEGHPYILTQSDRSAAGGTVRSIRDQVIDGVNLRGGRDFMFDPESQGQVWASFPSVVNNIHKRASALSGANGKDTLLLPYSMAPTGIDFATMPLDVMINFARQGMSKTNIKKLDSQIRKVIPEWQGVANPISNDVFRNVTGDKRKYVAQIIDKNFRDVNGGLSMGEARAATSSSDQYLIPDGSLKNVGIIDAKKPVLADSGHPTYIGGLQGEGVGRLTDSINARAFMDANGRRLANDSSDIRSLSMNPAFGQGIIDEKLLRFIDDHKKKIALVGGATAATSQAEDINPEKEARRSMSRRERRANPASEALRNYEQGKILPTLQNMGVGLVEGAADTLDILNPVNLGLNILNPANESAMRFLTPKYTPNKEAVAPLTDMRFYDQADPDSEKARKNARMAGALFSPI